MNDYVVLEEDLSRSVPGSPYIMEHARLTKSRPHLATPHGDDIPRLVDVIRLEIGGGYRLVVPQDGDYIDILLRIPSDRIPYLSQPAQSTLEGLAGEAGRDIKRAALFWAASTTKEEYYRLPRDSSEVFCYLACYDLTPLTIGLDRDYLRRAERLVVRFGLTLGTTKPVYARGQPEPAVQSSPTFQTPKRTITINKRR